MGLKHYRGKHIKRSYKEMMTRYEQSHLTGKELYDRYGIKRDEVLFCEVANFDNGYTLEVKMVAGEEDEYPDILVRLYSAEGAVEVDASENYDNNSLLGPFSIEDGVTSSGYLIKINMERCAIPVHYTKSNGCVSTAYCDSDWLLKWADVHQENLFRFLSEYTSDEAACLVGDAVLAHAVAFFYEEEDEPLTFYKDDEWKYKAFADVISEWLNNTHPEASRELDCFMRL